MKSDRKTATRNRWLETIDKHKRDFTAPADDRYWSPGLDTASRDELIAIQSEKIAALTPFLYENSLFYRARFDRLGLAPTDIRSIDDLAKWPVVDKQEMADDAAANPPYGTYTTMDQELWDTRGWMMFSSSGSTGPPRVFRYSQYDREIWEWADGRAAWAMGIRPSDTIFVASGYGPHVWAWGNQFAAARAGVATIPGGGMNAQMRANLIERFGPTVLMCTPSYALHLGRVMQDQGQDPGKTSIRILFVGGEPCSGIQHSRERLEDLWRARIVENYGCTEVSPHAGGFICTAHSGQEKPAAMHLMEDIQVWELVDPDSREIVGKAQRGLTVCTSLCSESSPQLRFLVGDYATFNTDVCECGITHVRAMGCFNARADDLINLRGLKMYPSQLEDLVRAVPNAGDEFEIVLSTNDEGMDIMDIRVEHPDYRKPDRICDELSDAVRSTLEVRVGVEVLSYDYCRL